MKMNISAEELASQIRDVWVKEYGEDMVAKFLPKKEFKDEEIRQELIKFLNDCYNIDSGFFSRYCKIPFKQILSWVEKQKHWKPSDKQMEAVKKAFRDLFARDLVDEDFLSLVNDLNDL